MLHAVMDKTRRALLVAAAVLTSTAGVAAVHASAAQAFNYPDNWTCALQSGQWCAQDEPQHNWTFGSDIWPYGVQHGIQLAQDCVQGYNQYGQYNGGRCVANASTMAVSLPGGYETVWIGESGGYVGMNGYAS